MDKQKDNPESHQYVGEIEYAEYIENAIEKKKEIVPFGIVMCDMNDLKRMNDTRGHSYGDEALRSASRMISETFKNSPVYRIGGDEFVALLDGKVLAHKDELMETFISEMNKLRNSTELPPEEKVSVAYGMAYMSDPSENVDDVIKEADERMYETKKKMKAGQL